MAGRPLIESLGERVERLIADNRRLRRESSEMARKAETLKGRNRELTLQISQLQHRIEVLELQGAISAGGDTKLAKARVNRLMREVDKCIALLKAESSGQ